jgi:Carboxypeptidase regulatory-like domain
MNERHRRAGRVCRLIGSTFLLAAMSSLLAVAADGTISGTVKDASGKALGGALVVAYDASNNLYRTAAEDNGTYSVSVPPGTYSVTATGRASLEATLTNLMVADGQKLEKQDLQLPTATPFPIVKATGAIPLTAGIDAPEFAGAPEIRVDRPWQVVDVLIDDSPSVWGGPQNVGGRFKLMYDATNLYVAGDLTFVHNRLNSNPGGDTYKGNGIELYLQNDPFDPNRTAYNPDHNWQLVIGLGTTLAMKLYGAIQAEANDNLGNILLVTDKPDNKGVFLRANLPWSMFLKEDKKTPIEPPKENALAAMDLVIDNTTPDAEQDNANRQFQLAWSGFNTGWREPRVLRPVQFCPKPPQ